MSRRWRYVASALLAATAIVPSHARELTFEQRVAAQRAIEDVYWRHRIWPKENPAPKPSLDAVMPESAIRAKVEDYLKKSNALEKFWGRPVTAIGLQAEMERMATHTRAGDVLREVFDALGNDPAVIAETLARQGLVDRLIRSWYARDGRFHNDVRRRAESALASHARMTELRGPGVSYVEQTWRLAEGQRAEERTERGDRTVVLGTDEWDALKAELAAVFAESTEPDSTLPPPWSEPPLPEGTPSALQENDDSFYVVAVLGEGKDSLSTITVSWPKVAFDDWWASCRSELSSEFPILESTFLEVSPLNATCSEGRWTTMASGVADPRESHTAVWTGSEMIVWGGYSGDYLSTGGRYNPSTDTWTATPTGPDTPGGRADHTAVWTGTEMIVWGGRDRLGDLNTGGRYDPATNTWRTTSVASPPERRVFHTMVWTGMEVIVWGGYGGDSCCSPLKSGGRYAPTTDTWTPTSTSASAPWERYWHSAIWTGDRMIVWGGYSFGIQNTGGMYDPATDSWAPTSVVPQKSLDNGFQVAVVCRHVETS